MAKQDSNKNTVVEATGDNVVNAAAADSAKVPQDQEISLNKDNAIVGQDVIQDVNEAQGAAKQAEAAPAIGNRPPEQPKVIKDLSGVDTTGSDAEDDDIDAQIRALQERKANKQKATSGISPEVAEVVASGVKQLGITAIADHKAHIAGVDYDLVKGRQYTVPEDVAFILCNAFVAMRR